MFSFTSGDVTYAGRMDAEVPTYVVPTLYDWKSTGDFRWQKSEEELKKDPAAIMYAVDFFRRNPSATQVRLLWVYMRTKGARAAQPTEVFFDQPSALAAFEGRIEPVARAMLETYRSTPKDDILSLPPNTSACDSYGGCPHTCRCTDLDPLSRMRAQMVPASSLTQHTTNENATEKENRPMGSLMDRVKNAGASTTTPSAAPAAPTPEAPAPAAINPPEGANGAESLMARVQAAAGIVPAAPAVPPGPETSPEVPAARKRVRPRKDAAPASAPAAPPSTKTPETAPDRSLPVSTSNIDVVYVDCGPDDGDYLTAHDFVEDARSKMREDGGGVLAEYVAKALTGHEYRAVRLDSGTKEYAEVAHEFLVRAKMVVR